MLFIMRFNNKVDITISAGIKPMFMTTKFGLAYGKYLFNFRYLLMVLLVMIRSCEM